MTCLEQPPVRPTIHALQWAFVLKHILRVRWPGDSDPHVSFALAQGMLIGLTMAGVIDEDANHRMFWLMTNAQDRRLAEAKPARREVPAF